MKEFDVRDEEEVLEKLLEAKVNGARDCYGYARAKMMQSVVGVVVVDGVNEAVSEAGDKTINKGSAGSLKETEGGGIRVSASRWLGNLTGSARTRRAAS